MNDIYKINKHHLSLGKNKQLNNQQLVSHRRIEQVCNDEQDFNKETKKEWSKMTKSQKIKKLKLFSQTYTDGDQKTKDKTDVEKTQICKNCWTFLRDAMDKKRINNKDIEYNVETERIVNIKSLVYNYELDRFALKRGNNGSSISGLPNFKLKEKNK